MARSGRVVSETGIYHVLLRGTNVLFPENADFVEFQGLLKKYVNAGSMKIYSYTLLKNRVHLVCETTDSIGRSLKPLCTSYARYVNRTYSREGKLFYDRLKSEPINSEEELKNAVAFINHISVGAGEGYPYCSISPEGGEVCTKDRLTFAERRSTKIKEMFIEDYDCLSGAELDGYIASLSGVLPKDFGGLTQEAQQRVLAVLTQKKWIAKTKLYGILGIKKNRPKTKTEKAPKPAEKKEELSVWLL